MEKRPDHSPEPRRDDRSPDEFFGLDVERMSPRAQVTTSLAVLIPVAVAGVLVLTLFSSFWWLIFVFGWTIFPAFGLLVRGIAGLSEGRSGLPPAEAAMETSLSVAEADRMLRELAEGGHLDVRVRGGGLFYSLWESEEDREARRLEGG